MIDAIKRVIQGNKRKRGTHGLELSEWRIVVAAVMAMVATLGKTDNSYEELLQAVEPLYEDVVFNGGVPQEVENVFRKDEGKANMVRALLLFVLASCPVEEFMVEMEKVVGEKGGKE